MRRQREKSTMSVLLALAFLAVPPLAAGVVYEIEVTDHEQSPPKSESIQAAVEGRHLKMGIASNGSGAQGEMIFRGDRREMVVVDHQDKSYFVMDEEAIGRIAGQVNSAMAQMQEALKSVPEDRRAMVEQMLKQRMPASTAGEEGKEGNDSELVKTKERGDKSGYPCVKYEVRRDGRKLRELWVTDWGNLEGGDEVAGAFADMADFFRELVKAIPKMDAGNQMDDSFFEYMKELDGFPVVTSEFGDDGSLENESTLRSSRRRTLDPAEFEPPSGYKRRQMFPQE